MATEFRTEYRILDNTSGEYMPSIFSDRETVDLIVAMKVMGGQKFSDYSIEHRTIRVEEWHSTTPVTEFSVARSRRELAREEWSTWSTTDLLAQRKMSLTNDQESGEVTLIDEILSDRGVDVWHYLDTDNFHLHLNKKCHISLGEYDAEEDFEDVTHVTRDGYAMEVWFDGVLKCWYVMVDTTKKVA